MSAGFRAVLVLAICFPGRATALWDTAGRVGCEVEASEEVFGSGALSDLRLDLTSVGDPATDPVESILARRFTDRSTQWSALGDLSAERMGRRTLRSHGRVQVSRARTRGDLELQTDGPMTGGRLSAGGRFLFQAGPEGGRAGRSLSLRSTWTLPSAAIGWEARFTAAGERSWAGADSLSSIFDYTRVLPSVEIRRSLSASGDLAVRGGWTRKSAYRSETGDYDERWAEGEWSWFSLSGAEAGVRARTQARVYPTTAAALPSFEESSLEGETELPLRRNWRLRLAPTYARAAYASDDSLVFRDHWSAAVMTRLERRLGGAGDDLDPAAAGATLHLGLRQAWLRNERVRAADYAATSVLFGVGREATARWWLDLTGEYGRRDYRGSGESGMLVYEGYNLTVSGTDFAFLSASMLAQASWKHGLRLELFGLYERERHPDAADDFTLWSWSAALTRAF